MTSAALLVSVALVSAAHASPGGPLSQWEGVWTFDTCHEDRKDDHDDETCGKSVDRIFSATDPNGRKDSNCREDGKPGRKDRKADEDDEADRDEEAFCREGMDRILIARDRVGRPDITLCPEDPWGEREVRIGGGHLSFRTREGLAVQLKLGADRTHFRGVFRSPDGHSGRAWGRRVAGCK